ncbi:hypothetical protein V8C26DRAFT_414385 [Trichoderma gracile]
MPVEGWAGKSTCKSSRASLPICFSSSCQCVWVDPWCARVQVCTRMYASKASYTR